MTSKEREDNIRCPHMQVPNYVMAKSRAFIQQHPHHMNTVWVVDTQKASSHVPSENNAARWPRNRGDNDPLEAINSERYKPSRGGNCETSAAHATWETS